MDRGYTADAQLYFTRLKHIVSNFEITVMLSLRCLGLSHLCVRVIPFGSNITPCSRQFRLMQLNKIISKKAYIPRSSTCALRGFFWLLSHMIYLKLTRELQECLLSQASIFWTIDYSYIKKSYLALWQNCYGQFITQKFPSLKSKQFSQFFLVRGKSERIDKI